MSNSEFGSLTIFLFLLLAAARLCGHLFTRLHQPKVVGEIVAGVLLGPSLVGRLTHLWPTASLIGGTSPSASVLFFLYNFGLLLLMFASGTETKGLFHREDRKQVAWLGALGTGVPFVAAICLMPLLPLHLFAGRIPSRLPLMLVVSIAVSVTSIPVISKIFHDLGILHTRFSRLVLGVAVIEDIVLWAILAIATALAQSGDVPHSKIAAHIALTVAYFGLGLIAAPRFLYRLNRSRWNLLIGNSPIAYAVVVLLAYAGIAALLDINLVFAAFLAGYAVIADRESMASAVASISEVAFAVFIPIYFAIVGYRLDLGRSFSLGMIAAFLLLSSAGKFFSAGIGAQAAGFNLKDSINLAAALNARGGPGIVVATVAYDAGVINATFCTTLIVVAILTSQAAGTWLGYITHKGQPLLSPQPGRSGIHREQDVAVTV